MKDNFIADRITELRMKRDISEYNLSYSLGKSKSYIGEITAGKCQPSVDMLLAICEWFEITPAEFFLPDETEGDREFYSNYKRLGDNDRATIARIIRLMLEDSSEQKKK